MTGIDYRIPNRMIAPGEKVDEKDFEIIHAMRVKSLITNPGTGHKMAGRTLEVRGHAWAGDRKVDSVRLSIDFGATWTDTKLDEPVNAYAWQNWRAKIAFPKAGYYEIWARATDSQGVSQPYAIAWNPKGYLNNSMHRIAVIVS